ncbi:MAG: 5'/3'-nucleotidase SurE [Treponema sp.]|nr:5'/3'-nucleotidase SurE [Candidatus Treponema merdequi]
MKVLITNDDGYGEPGINSLIAGLSKRHEVYVMAPAANQSGTSNSIHLTKPLEIKKINDSEWTLNGSPADCVITACKSDVFDFKFDAVVSGINKGFNIGNDITYSGTCGAARQAVISGIPGIAVSMQLKDEFSDKWNDLSYWHFDELSEFVSKNLEQLCKMCVVTRDGLMPQDKACFVNVNSYSIAKFNGVKFTDVCFREYIHDKVKIEQNEFEVLSIFSGGPGSTKSRKYSDFDACSEDCISISRILAEPVVADDGFNLDSIKFSL